MKWCKHKTFKDFTEPLRTSDGALIWKCSGCGARDRWSDGWTYFGNIECKTCWTAAIERVFCPACAKGKDKLDDEAAKVTATAKQARAEARVARLKKKVEKIDDDLAAAKRELVEAEGRLKEE